MNDAFEKNRDIGLFEIPNTAKQKIRMSLTPCAQTSPLGKQENLAESFEKAFQACHACLTHPEGYLRTDHEETRATGLSGACKEL